MELKTDIICRNYNIRKINDGKIEVEDANEEYYVVPLNKSWDRRSDGEMFQLTFTNNLLWWKQSTMKNIITIGDCDFTEFIVIKAKDIYDIYMRIHCYDYLIKKVYQMKNRTYLNKQYLGKNILIIPVFEDNIEITSHGTGIIHYEITMNSNEAIIRTAKSNHNGHAYIPLTTNVQLSKEALFVVLDDVDFMNFTLI